MRPGALLAVFGLAASSQAIVIDAFNAGDVTLSVDTNGPEMANLTGAPVFGGGRATFIRQTTGNGNLTSKLQVSTDLFGLGNSGNTVSRSSLGYGVTNVTNSGGFFYSLSADMSFGGAHQLRFDFLRNDKPLGLVVALVDDTSAAVYRKDIDGGQLQPFSIFITDSDLISGTPHWSNFDLLRVDFFTAAGANVDLDLISAVPEPATFSAAAIGLFVILKKRRT